MEHLPELQLRLFAKARLVHPHIRRCALCRARFLQLTSAPPVEYETALCRASQKVEEFLPRVQEENASTVARLAEILALGESARSAKIASDSRFQTYALAARVLDESESWISHDPSIARDLARLALSITVQIDPRTCGGARVLADLEAYCQAMEGNALRVCGQVQAALESFRAARAIQERGGDDPDFQARIDFLESSLRRDLRQFSSARVLLQRATYGFGDLHNDEWVAKTLVGGYNIAADEKSYDEAATFLERALQWTRDPKLLFMIRHNHTALLIGTGNPQAAARLLEKNKELYLQFTDPLTVRRRIWMEGIIARDLGENFRARELLIEAVAGLAASGFGMDAALAGIDLEVLRRQETAPASWGN